MLQGLQEHSKRAWNKVSGRTVMFGAQPGCMLLKAQGGAKRSVPNISGSLCASISEDRRLFGKIPS